MPPPGRKSHDRGVSAQQRGVRAAPYEPSSASTEQELRAILVRPVPAGSDQRRSALVSFLAPMPMVEKARLLTQLSAPRDPLTTLLRHQVHPSTVTLVLRMLEAGSGRQTARPAPERMTGDALKGEFLAISEAPLTSGPLTSIDDAAAGERADELYAELGGRGEAYSQPDPATQRQMDLDQRLHDATQRFDYTGIDLEYLKSTFEKPPVDNLGGRAQGYCRNLLQTSDGSLFPVNEAAITADAGKVVSKTGPETIGQPYFDHKQMTLAIRYPVHIGLASGEQKTYVFEVWWFADERSEYNALRGHAERASDFHPSAEARAIMGGEMQSTLNVLLGILMRPLVGDRILQAQMKREMLHAAVTGVGNKLADKAAGAVQRRMTGAGGEPDAPAAGRRRIDVSKSGALRQLRGATPDEVAEALTDPALYSVYKRSLSGDKKGQQAAADLNDLAAAIGEHSSDGPGGRARVNPTVAAAVWAMPENLRGVLIEKSLANTQYKGWYNVGATDRGFFPDIDFSLSTPGSGPQQRVSVKTVNPFTQGYEKQLGETLPAHVETIVTATDNLRRSGQRVPTTTVDVRMPPGSSVPGAALAQTLRALIPRDLAPYVKVQVGEF